MDSAFAENRRLRNAKLVKEYLAVHHCDTYSLFSTAYFHNTRVVNKYEIQKDVDRFGLAEEVPSYVVAYLCIKQN